MTKTINSLKVITVVRNGKNKGKVTDITISIDGTGIIVARATFGGKWDRDAVLAEYKRLPHRFKLDPEGHRTAGLMKLAA